VSREDDTLIGSAGLHNWNREGNFAEIGFDIAYTYWSEGYATEVLQALIQFGWGNMKLNRIEAKVVKGNLESIHVLEKMGFKQEGVLRQRLLKGGKYYDIHFLGLLQSDYEAMSEKMQTQASDNESTPVG